VFEVDRKDQLVPPDGLASTEVQVGIMLIYHRDLFVYEAITVNFLSWL